MTTREARLTAAVAAAGLLWGVSRGVSSYREQLDDNDQQRIAAQQALSDARVEAYRGQKARQQLRAWQKQSLPADADVAESLYRDWLQDELKAAGITNPSVADRARALAGEGATELTFNVGGQGTLAQWLEFFRRFAAGPHLHRLSETTLAPTPDRQQLTGTLRIDALVLSDSPRTAELAADDAFPPDAKAVEKFAASIAAITARNPFQPPSAKPNGDAGNQAGKAKVTFLFGGRDGWIVDVRREDTGKVERYKAGDTVRFGTFEAKLLELDERRVLYETTAGKFEVKLGQNFGEAQPATDG